MRTILICDDSVTMQQVVRMTFVGQEFRVEAAGDCDEALALAHRVSPAVILADLSMTGKTGYDLTEAVRRDGQLQTTPVLLLASTHEPVDEERVRSCGADGHMNKPFESQALIERVRELAESAHVVEPAAAAPPAEAEEPLLDLSEPPPEQPAPEPAAAAPAGDDFELEIVLDEPVPTPTPAAEPPAQAAPPSQPSPAPPARQPSPPPPALSYSPPPAAAPFSAPARPTSPRPVSPPPAAPSPAPPPAMHPPSPAPPPAAMRRPSPVAPPRGSPAPPSSVFSAPARPGAPGTRTGAHQVPGARMPSPGTPGSRPAPGAPRAAAPSRGAQAPSPWVPPPSAAPRTPGRGPASSTARPTPASQGVQVRRTPPVPGGRPVPVPRPTGPTAATMVGMSRPPQLSPSGTPGARPPIASATRPQPGGGRVSEQELVARLSKDVIERVVWEVVPELAETIIRQELDRLIAAREREPK